MSTARMTELSYMRMENSLLRAFDGWPAITPPKPRDIKARTFSSCARMNRTT